MRTVHVPQLIESVEQAEALPVGTLAISSEMYDSGTTMHWAAVKVDRDWARTDVADGQPMLGDAAMVDPDSPWTALLPVEVEVEYIRESSGRRRTKTLYVTEWSTPNTVEPDGEGEALADCGDEA